jgi:hypothetical protein
MKALPAPERGSVDWWASYVWWFMRRRMGRQEGARVDAADIYRSFLAWWADSTVWSEPPIASPSPRDFATALAKICDLAAVLIEMDGGRVYCCDCCIIQVSRPRAGS